MLATETLVHSTPTAMPRVRPVAGVATRVDVAFTNKAGVEKNDVRKHAEKLLSKVAPALQRVLAADEFVVYVAGGCAPMRALEQYTFGYFAQFVSRVTLVFTNKRLLAFRVDQKGEWRKSLRGCSLGDIKSAKVTGWIVGYLRLQYADGKKESYWALKRRDMAKLKVLLPKLLEAAPQTHAQGMQPLCPTCAAMLVDRQYECTGCGQKFRNEESLWWRTMIPGGGYFYARQTGMGILHSVVDSFISLEVVVLLLAALTAKPNEVADFWGTFGLFVFIWLFERAIALQHARRFVREFIPIDGTARAQASTAVRQPAPR